MGDHLQQGRPSIAAIDGPAGPSMATKSAMDGPAAPVVAGDHLRCDMSLAVANLGMEDDDDEPVPFPNVNSVIMKKVLEWAEHHKEDPPPPEDDDNKEKRTNDIDPWDQEFLRVDQGTLFELILAANYLNIKGLLDVTCKTVANMIKGKTPEEIKKTFNIKNDFTPEEEQVS